MSNPKSKKQLALKNFLFALSAIIIIGACTLIIFLNPSKKIDTTSNKTIFNISPELFLANNYIPHPEIEKELSTPKKFKAYKLNVVLPVDSSVFVVNEIINFKTKGLARSPFKIIIYNNKGAKVFESEIIPDNDFTYESTLSPGIYYWKIQLKKISTWGGRFYIISK